MVEGSWWSSMTSIRGIPKAVLVIANLVALCYSTPTISFPINSQLPPVARIDEPFSFVISPQTVTSPTTINYALARSPPWLSLTSDQRLLTGTPTEKDVPPGLVVGIPLGIRATDSNGTIQINATLVVARTPAPEFEVPLSDQLASFGPHSPPDSLLLYEEKPFSFSFDQNTFKSIGQWGLTYYATNRDNTPLPSWIRFNPNTLTFSGTAPAFKIPTQPPQRFELNLIASDVVGFAALSFPFSVVVSNHVLSTTDNPIRLNVTRGQSFVYSDFLSQIKLDSRSLELKELAASTPIGMPSWLSLDASVLEFKGTPPANATASNFTIGLVDQYSDQLNVTFQINFDDAIFKGDLPPLKLTAGEEFDYEVKPYLNDPSDIELSVDSDSDISWIKVDQTALSISGTVPDSLGARETEPLSLSVVATSKRTQSSEAQQVSVDVANSGIVTTPTTSDTPSSTASQSATTGPIAVAAEEPRTYLWLLLPILLIIFVGIIFLFFWWRRRRMRKHRKIHKSEVSAPLPGTWTHNGAAAPPDDRSSSDSHGNLNHTRRDKHLPSSPRTPSTIAVGGFIRRASNASRSMRHQNNAKTPSPPPLSAKRRLKSVPIQPAADHSQPHAMATSAVAVHNTSRNGDAHDGIEHLRQASPASQDKTRPAQRTTADEASLLSDTTIGEADSNALRNRSTTSGAIAVLAEGGSPQDTNPQEPMSMLSVPPAHQQHSHYPHYRQNGQEVSSIQPTPEMAYEARNPTGNKYDFASSGEEDESCEHPTVGYQRTNSKSTRRRSHRGNSIRSAMGQRWSRVWRGGNGGDPSARSSQGPGGSRYSQHTKQGSDAASSVQTRTSILTTAMAEQTQTATTATPNLASPVIVNIPNRSPNPRTKQRTSKLRQDEELAPLFSAGGAVGIGKPRSKRSSRGSPGGTKSKTPSPELTMRAAASTTEPQPQPQSQQMQELAEPPPGMFTAYDPSKPRPSDSSWDRFARDAVGVAHKDIVNQSREEPSNAMGIAVPPLRTRGPSVRPKSPAPRPASLQSITEVPIYEDHDDGRLIGVAVSSAQARPVPSRNHQLSGSGRWFAHPGWQSNQAGVGRMATMHNRSLSTGSIQAPSIRSNTMSRMLSDAGHGPANAIAVSPLSGAATGGTREMSEVSLGSPINIGRIGGPRQEYDSLGSIMAAENSNAALPPAIGGTAQTQEPQRLTSIMNRPRPVPTPPSLVDYRHRPDEVATYSQEGPSRRYHNLVAPRYQQRESVASKPSVRTAGSEGQWEDVDDDEEDGDADDDEDVWEDIQPPESTRGGPHWDSGDGGGSGRGSGSHGSYLVYI